jgi:hypothetical protein
MNEKIPTRTDNCSYAGRRFGSRVLCVVAASLALALTVTAEEWATGVVFHDRNGNGVRDAGEEGLGGVFVSNQREVVATDEEGRWRLPVEEDDTIFFVIKPSGWMPPVDRNNLPQFYYIHKPNGSPLLQFAGVAPTGPLPESIDFPLVPQEENDRFDVLFIGDPQPRNLRELDYIAQDVIPELFRSGAALGISLGDLTFNNLNLFEPLAEVFAGAGIPWYNIVGNHDLNFDALDPRYGVESFRRVFGPDYYSFNWGNTHFIAINNNQVVPSIDGGSNNWTGTLGSRQLEFIRNNLAVVPPEKRVVVMMHVPFHNHRWNREEAQELFRMLGQHPNTVSVSAHMHAQHIRVVEPQHGWPRDETHHHFVVGTLGGSFWAGFPDELGIPHSLMPDGTPRGYGVFTFNPDATYTARYQVTRRPPDYQMNISAPTEVRQDQAAETEVYVNVFAGTQYSTVEMRLGESGAWTRLRGAWAHDPVVVAAHAREVEIPMPYRRTIAAGNSPHLWVGRLPEFPPLGANLLHVRTVDMFGQTFADHRLVRIAMGMTPGDREMFYDASKGIRIAFGSEAGVDREQIRLVLDGVDRSEDLEIGGDAQRREIHFADLRPNRLYRAEVEITDRSGASHTRSAIFDTFEPGNFTWEGVDYNYGGGKFLDDPPLDPMVRPSYRYKEGVQGIDKHEINKAGPRDYRLNDDVSTTRKREPTRPHLVENRLPDYVIGWNVPGEWLNYTRTFPSGRFNVYGRFAYGRNRGFAAQLDRVTSDPTQPDQQTQRLGTFTLPGGTDSWDDYQFVPLLDENGELAVVEFDGVGTVRITDIGSSFALNYFMLAPVGE